MRILAIHHALPGLKVHNKDLIKLVMESDENRVPAEERAAFRTKLEEHLKYCGANTRFHRTSSEKALDLGIKAGNSALSSSGLSPGDIDLLIYVGVGRGFIEPATANIFQDALGLSNATCFDILDACASWIRALDVARSYMERQYFQRVMILNCEFNFHEYVRLDFRSLSDFEYLGAGLTIGEAATATILGDENDGDGYYSSFRTRGALSELCKIPLSHHLQFQAGKEGNIHPPGRFFAYSGRLHKAAIGMMVRHYWDEEQLHQIQPDIIFGHSTSVPAALSVAKHLRLDLSRYVDIFPMFGNTVSASVPLAMSIAEKEGRLSRGSKVLIAVASAGVTTAFCRFTY